MLRIGLLLAAATTAAVLAACIMARGADLVRITHDPADVASCTPLRGLDNGAKAGSDGDRQRQLRNLAADAGGNVVLDTTLGSTVTGVIYRCSAAAATLAGR